MSEEKSSPIGIIVVVAVIAVVAGIFLFKGGSNNGDQNAGNQQQPTNGSDTNKTTPPPEPPKPEKPAEPKEPAFVNDGLVAYYPFNGNAKDESGNGNDGEVKGAALAEDRHGEPKNAYAFNGGSDQIRIADSELLRPDHITISVWQFKNSKALQIAGAGDEGALVYKTEQTKGARIPGVRLPNYEQYGLTSGVRAVRASGSGGEETPFAEFHIKRNSGGATAAGWQKVRSSTETQLKKMDHGDSNLGRPYAENLY